jgi:hypothetical protein
MSGFLGLFFTARPFSSTCPSSTGEKWVLYMLVRAVVSWTAVLCRRPSGPRLSAHHVETTGQPNEAISGMELELVSALGNQTD